MDLPNGAEHLSGTRPELVTNIRGINNLFYDAARAFPLIEKPSEQQISSPIISPEYRAAIAHDKLKQEIATRFGIKDTDAVMKQIQDEFQSAYTTFHHYPLNFQENLLKVPAGENKAHFKVAIDKPELLYSLAAIEMLQESQVIFTRSHENSSHPPQLIENLHVALEEKGENSNTMSLDIDLSTHPDFSAIRLLNLFTSRVSSRGHEGVTNISTIISKAAGRRIDIHQTNAILAEVTNTFLAPKSD